MMASFGCGAEAPSSDELSSVEEPLAGATGTVAYGLNGITASVALTSSSASGYCANLTLTNRHRTTSAGSWAVRLGLGNGVPTAAYTSVLVPDPASTAPGRYVIRSTTSGVPGGEGTLQVPFCVTAGMADRQPAIWEVTSNLPSYSPDPWQVGMYRFASAVDRRTLSVQSGAVYGGEHTGGRNQQWRFRLDSGTGPGYFVSVEGTRQCLLASGTTAYLGACTASSTRWNPGQIRGRYESMPGVFRLTLTGGNQCLRPAGTGRATLGACDTGADLYMEPAGYGERLQAAEYQIRALMIVKRRTNVPGTSRVGEIPDAVVRGASLSFRETTAEFMRRITDGRVEWIGDVVESPSTLTSLQGAGGNWIPHPDDVRADIVQFAPAGRYDFVTILYTPVINDQGWGWDPGTSRNSNYAGYITVNAMNGPTTVVGWNSFVPEPTEVFIHEPMHALDGFFGKLGVPVPGLHSGTDYLYGAQADEGWSPWYRDYYLGRVIGADGKYSGFGPRAFRLGNIRTEAASIRNPAWLTSARRATSLLKNGGFESSTLPWPFTQKPTNWSYQAWVPERSSFELVSGARTGSDCLRISSSAANDARLYQKVTAQPNTRYVLAGWIRTQNVVRAEEGRIGATLSASSSVGSVTVNSDLLGTNDWTYVADEILSGPDGVIEVSARLGGTSSTVTGRAYFDDMVLVPF